MDHANTSVPVMSCVTSYSMRTSETRSSFALDHPQPSKKQAIDCSWAMGKKDGYTKHTSAGMQLVVTTSVLHWAT